MNQHQPVKELPADRLLQLVTRTLRHEVGDLLQTIYSTVAILQERIPRDAQLERRFLSDLRGRAETCKDELDAVHDLVLPMSLNIGPVDLAELSAGLVGSFASRSKSVEIQSEPSRPLALEADAARLSQVGRMLLTAASQLARRRVTVQTKPGPSADTVQWDIADDGHGATPEQMAWLTTPFATTQQAVSGLSLALARKVAEMHGGTVTAENLPGEGFRVSIVLPRQARPART
jgi:two-component system, NtrC family, sensor histidine kinase HydH